MGCVETSTVDADVAAAGSAGAVRRTSDASNAERANDARNGVEVYAAKRKRILFALAAFYAVFIPTFIWIGFGEVKSEQTYAVEAQEATEHLAIAEIGLDAPVKKVEVQGTKLEVPEQIAGSYTPSNNKTLLIGHSSTIFKNLDQLRTGDEIVFNDERFIVANTEVLTKAEIDMSEILKDEEARTLILMTCAGENIGGNDFSHRLIVTAMQN